MSGTTGQKCNERHCWACQHETEARRRPAFSQPLQLNRAIIEGRRINADQP